MGSCTGAYHANAFSDGCREGIDNIHRRVQPFRQAVIASSRLVEVLDLLSKNKENAVGSIAGLELGGKWVREKVLLCTFFICFQGITEILLKVGGRCGSRVCAKHKCGSKSLFGWWWMVGDGFTGRGLGLGRGPLPGVLGRGYAMRVFPRTPAVTRALQRTMFREEGGFTWARTPQVKPLFCLDFVFATMFDSKDSKTHLGNRTALQQLSNLRKGVESLFKSLGLQLRSLYLIAHKTPTYMISDNFTTRIISTLNLPSPLHKVKYLLMSTPPRPTPLGGIWRPTTRICMTENKRKY